MKALIRTEASRLRHRRAVVGWVLVAVFLPLAIAGSTLWSQRPVDPSERVEAVATAERESARLYAECVRSPMDWFGTDELSAEEVEAECRMSTSPTADGYLEREPLDLTNLTAPGGTMLGVICLLAAIFFAAGASFAGADWASRSLSNQLLMEPRRARVWVAKSAALAGTSVVVSAVSLTLFWSIMWGFSRLWDRPIRHGIGELLLWTNLRGLALIAVAGVVGFALAMLLRNSGAALVVLISFVLLIPFALEALSVDEPEPWAPVLNVQAWVEHGALYWPRECYEACAGTIHSFTAGGAYLLVFAILAIAGSIWSFSRRDIS